MAKNKRDTSPLFEIIRGADQPARREFRLPPWMRRRATESRGPEPPPSPPPSAAPPGVDRSEAEKPAAREEAERPRLSMDDRLADAKAWLRRPLMVRLPRGTAIALAVAGVAIVVIGYWVGYRVGFRRTVAFEQNVREVGASVRDIREGPITAPISSSVAGVGAGAGVAAGPGSERRVDGGDPRVPGLNYFRLAYVPASAREKISGAVAFLERNGIDAALIPTNNGDSLALTVLPGFRRPRSDPEAIALRDRLLTLGRKWEAQEGGATDWSDLYPAKYQPGEN